MRAVPLRSERLALEPLAAAHADELAPLLDDPGLHAFTGGQPLHLDALRERYARLEGAEDRLNWIVRAGADAVGYVQATVEGEAADVAWVIGTAHQGRGYAREAAAAMVAWLRAQGVRRIAANIHPEHAASIAIARHLWLEPGAARADGEIRWAGPG
jgi:RimJ/RimL family protein N-acetyltransferase